MSALRLRRAGPADRTALTDLLSALSAESSYRRFQAALGPTPRASVLDALLPEGSRGGAMLAYAGPQLVGHGVWRRAGTSPVAEIGLVVADAHQERGVGTALAEALISDLAAQGVERVEVFATATNEAVARMVARRAPDAVRERDGATVTYLFPVQPTRARTVA
jgi:GNAT superfamily N-acetyltransferase